MSACPIVDGKSEGDVVAERGFRHDLSASLSSHMRLQGGVGGSYYRTGYPGIEYLTITTRPRQCVFNTGPGVGAAELMAQIRDALDDRAETWTHTETQFRNVIAQGHWDLDGTGFSVRYLLSADGAAIAVVGSASASP